MKDAPRVTLAEIEAAVTKTDFVLLPDGRTTICMLTLDNGFTVRGESSCVCLANYDQELGEKYAKESATDKLWMLLGFRLADKLHQIKLRKGRGAKFRDAESGLYVTKAFARLNPGSTVKEG